MNSIHQSASGERLLHLVRCHVLASFKKEVSLKIAAGGEQPKDYAILKHCHE